MHFFTAFLAIGAATPALAAISLGSHSGYEDVAWRSGENPCSDGRVQYGVIRGDGNPCDRGEFKVKDSWYKLEGCGGKDFKIVRTHPGGWEAPCVSKHWTCNGWRTEFQQDWQCGDD